MIFRIGRGHIKPGGWDAYERAFHEHLIEGEWPAGLRGRWLVRDLNDENGGWTIGLWDDVESIEAWQASDGFASAQEAFRPYFVGDYQAQVGEVRASRTA